MSIQISIVIPVYNEEGSIEELYDKLTEVLADITNDYEILFVDDGSMDSTLKCIKTLHKRDEHVNVLAFETNFGKSAALNAGFQVAKGKIVFTMDGDLQDDPKEIPRFIAKINAGYDLVTGWKFKRHDPIGKTLPSKFFNWLTAKVTGAKVHDSNCGYKAYKKKVVKKIKLQKGFHRYIPAIATYYGFRIGEMKVRHHPREHGSSKYGPERLLKGLLDLVRLKSVYINHESQRRFYQSLFLLAGVVCITVGIGGIYFYEFNNGLENRYFLFPAFAMLVLAGSFLLPLAWLFRKSLSLGAEPANFVLKKP